MPVLHQDATYFQTGLESLETYLLSEELYWPVSTTLPNLTIGGILLAGKRLEVRMPPEQWRVLFLQLDKIRSKWRSAWERKAGREIHARLVLWGNYLEDIRKNPDSGNYSQQVQWRVMLHLLNDEFISPPPEMLGIDKLDDILRIYWIAGKFIWDIDLSDAFPETTYWFLYGKLKID